MKPWAERVDLPKEEGVYWARSGNYKWWNLIVHVYGDAPFFQIDIWQFNHGIVVVKAAVHDIEEFGPRIETP